MQGEEAVQSLGWSVVGSQKCFPSVATICLGVSSTLGKASGCRGIWVWVNGGKRCFASPSTRSSWMQAWLNKRLLC